MDNIPKQNISKCGNYEQLCSYSLIKTSFKIVFRRFYYNFTGSLWDKIYIKIGLKWDFISSSNIYENDNMLEKHGQVQSWKLIKIG